MMGDDLTRRMIAALPYVPEEAQGLAVLLAKLAHDGDAVPCCWPTPETLTVLLYGEDTPATRRRFYRRREMLIDAGLITRATKPHHPRPRSRTCPRDGRKFHVELSVLSDATRPIERRTSRRR